MSNGLKVNADQISPFTSKHDTADHGVFKLIRIMKAKVPGPLPGLWLGGE